MESGVNFTISKWSLLYYPLTPKKALKYLSRSFNKTYSVKGHNWFTKKRLKAPNSYPWAIL